MYTLNQDTHEADVDALLRGARASRRAAAQQPDFAATEFMFNECDPEYTGFAPTRLPADAWPGAVLAKPVAKSPVAGSDAMLAAWNTARWVEEQEALAVAAARRAAAAVQHAKRTPDCRSSRLAAVRRQGGWLARLEAALNRILPPGFGSLLGLFLCVSLSLALISSMLPIVDRL